MPEIPRCHILWQGAWFQRRIIPRGLPRLPGSRSRPVQRLRLSAVFTARSVSTVDEEPRAKPRRPISFPAPTRALASLPGKAVVEDEVQRLRFQVLLGELIAVVLPLFPRHFRGSTPPRGFAVREIMLDILITSVQYTSGGTPVGNYHPACRRSASRLRRRRHLQGHAQVLAPSFPPAHVGPSLRPHRDGHAGHR